MNPQKLSWIFLVFVVFLGGIATAQVTTGTISGTVKDGTGAVVPGAKVVILNEDTGIPAQPRPTPQGTFPGCR